MTSFSPVHATYNAGNSDGLSEFKANEAVDTSQGLILPASALYVGSDGTKGWRDLTTDITVRGTGANNPSWSVFQNGIYAYEFPGTGMKEVWCNFHIPHDYAPGTDLYFHVHYANATATPSTNNFYWQFEYTWAQGFDQMAFGATTTIGVTQAGSSTRYQHMIAETTGQTLTGLEVDSIILCRVFRDAAHINDTNADTVHLFFVDIHYQTSTFSTKNKAPNFYT